MASLGKTFSVRQQKEALLKSVGSRLESDRLFQAKKFRNISYERVREHLLHMNNRLNAEGCGLYLATEKDVCVAHCGLWSGPFPFHSDDRLKLMAGQTVVKTKGIVQPLLLNNSVIGFILAKGRFPEDIQVLTEICVLYGQLIIKEMQLEFSRSKVEYYSHSLIQEKRESKIEARENSMVMEMAVHDLSSPLSAIHGYLELIENNLQKDQDLKTIKQYYDRIAIGIHDISSIISQFEDLRDIKSKSGELNLVQTNLNWLVRDVTELYRGKAERQNLELKTRLPEKPVYVYADIGKIKRSIINLVANAIKFSKKGGLVKVELDADEAYAVINVIDNGIGISKEKQAEIFKPFFQVSDHKHMNDPGSAGLGLYIASSFVKQMQGLIDMKSTEGKGSRFSILLPRVQKEEL